jgi:hypothetical protein
VDEEDVRPRQASGNQRPPKGQLLQDRGITKSLLQGMEGRAIMSFIHSHTQWKSSKVFVL